jgi:SET domain-containing protein
MKTTGAPVEVKGSRKAVGEGLFACADIQAGDFIVEYLGKKIPTNVADTLKTRYLFELDEEWTIDGETYSNIARFINHSCEPNAEGDIHDGHIMISAVRNIKTGEEITIDYGKEYFDEFIRPFGCRCGARKHSYS